MGPAEPIAGKPQRETDSDDDSEVEVKISSPMFQMSVLQSNVLFL